MYLKCTYSYTKSQLSALVLFLVGGTRRGRRGGVLTAVSRFVGCQNEQQLTKSWSSGRGFSLPFFWQKRKSPAGARARMSSRNAGFAKERLAALHTLLSTYAGTPTPPVPPPASIRASSLVGEPTGSPSPEKVSSGSLVDESGCDAIPAYVEYNFDQYQPTPT
jgi:hypothetical protein